MGTAYEAHAMNEADFIAGYCKRSRISEESFHKHRIAMPCACGVDECQGWAAVPHDCKESHLELYSPEREEPK